MKKIPLDQDFLFAEARDGMTPFLQKMITECNKFNEENDTCFEVGDYVYLLEQDKDKKIQKPKIPKSSKALQKVSGDRDLESKYKVWLSVGIVGLLSVIASGQIVKGWKYLSPVIKNALRSAKTWTIQFIQKHFPIKMRNVVRVTPIALFAHVLYRKRSDTCRKYCGGSGGEASICYWGCYIRACDEVLLKINRDLQLLGKIDDRSAKATLHGKLMAQKRFYESKKEKYVVKMQKARRKYHK